MDESARSIFIRTFMVDSVEMTPEVKAEIYSLKAGFTLTIVCDLDLKIRNTARMTNTPIKENSMIFFLSMGDEFIVKLEFLIMVKLRKYFS